jgi:hypothetical protein
VCVECGGGVVRFMNDGDGEVVCVCGVGLC